MPGRSVGAGSVTNRWWFIFFFSLFAVAGVIAFYGFFVRVVLRVEAARSWAATPCVIESSRVKTETGSEGGETYSVDIQYNYTLDGRVYHANRYDFMSGSTSAYAGKEAIVRANPVGRVTVCYINPMDPADAVMDRGYPQDILFSLIPIVFVAIGMGGIIWQLKAANKT